MVGDVAVEDLNRARGAGDVDDAAVRLPTHDGDDGAGHGEAGGEVALDAVAPLGVGGGADVGVCGLPSDGNEPCVVDTDVESVRDTERRRDHTLGRTRLHQVGDDPDGDVPLSGELGGALVDAVGGGAEDHCGTVGGERMCCHETDAVLVAGTRDECDLAQKTVEEAHRVKCSTAS